MRFGPTLAGAVVGAAIGVVLHLALEVYGGIEAPWFAILIGLLVGLFVRKFDKSCAGHVSYVRGALAGLIALGAIVGSTYLLSFALAKASAMARGKPALVAAQPADEDAAREGGEADATELEPDVPLELARPAPFAGAGRAGGAGELSVLQFIFIAVGTFIAYELGRGTGRTPAPQQPTAEP